MHHFIFKYEDTIQEKIQDIDQQLPKLLTEETVIIPFNSSSKSFESIGHCFQQTEQTLIKIISSKADDDFFSIIHSIKWLWFIDLQIRPQIQGTYHQIYKKYIKQIAINKIDISIKESVNLCKLIQFFLKNKKTKINNLILKQLVNVSLELMEFEKNIKSLVLLECKMSPIPLKAPSLLRWGLVQDLHFYGTALNIKLVRCMIRGGMQAIEKMDFRDCEINNECLKELLKSNLKRLRHLELRNNIISEIGFKWLSKTNLMYLRDLVLFGKHKERMSSYELTHLCLMECKFLNIRLQGSITMSFGGIQSLAIKHLAKRYGYACTFLI